MSKKNKQIIDIDEVVNDKNNKDLKSLVKYHKIKNKLKKKA